MIKNIQGLHLKCMLFLSDFNEIWIFHTGFFKKTQILNFMKIRPLESELFHADGRTDMTKLFVTFLSFANGLEKQRYEQEIMPPYDFVRYKTCIDTITTANNRQLTSRTVRPQNFLVQNVQKLVTEVGRNALCLNCSQWLKPTNFRSWFCESGYMAPYHCWLIIS
jgi:hypothetical protein